jgi:hypothetical protein
LYQWIQLHLLFPSFQGLWPHLVLFHPIKRWPSTTGGIKCSNQN